MLRTVSKIPNNTKISKQIIRNVMIENLTLSPNFQKECNNYGASLKTSVRPEFDIKTILIQKKSADIGQMIQQFYEMFGSYTVLTITKDPDTIPLIGEGTFSNGHKQRFFSCKASCGDECDSSSCAPPKEIKPVQKDCPPKKWQTGCCCRVTMPDCKESCQYHRDFCCKKAERKRKTGCRIRTPMPSYIECCKKPIKYRGNPECLCNEPQSVCGPPPRKC